MLLDELLVPPVPAVLAAAEGAELVGALTGRSFAEAGEALGIAVGAVEETGALFVGEGDDDLGDRLLDLLVALAVALVIAQIVDGDGRDEEDVGDVRLVVAEAHVVGVLLSRELEHVQHVYDIRRLRHDAALAVAESDAGGDEVLNRISHGILLESRETRRGFVSKNKGFVNPHCVTFSSLKRKIPER